MRAASSLATRLTFNHIDAQTVALLKEAREFVIPAMPAILDGFYDHVGRFSETNTFFRSREHMMHAKAMQMKHWAIILEGRFDADYEASVTRIGEVHNKLGLEPRWYIGGYNALLSALVSEIALRVPGRLLDRGSASKKAAMQQAIINAAMLDMDIAITVYIDAGRRDRRQTLDGLAANFEAAIGSVVDVVASASTELQAAAQSLQRATAPNLDAVEPRHGVLAGSHGERQRGGRRRRATDELHSRDQRARQRFRPDFRRSKPEGECGRREDAAFVGRRTTDRRHCRPDHQHCRPDQPSGLERDDRSRQGR